MDKSYELKYHALEENHWWFEARRDVLFKLIQKISKNSKILEMGCSGGSLIKFLEQRGFKNVYGIDISEDAINLCKKRGARDIFVMDATKPKFDDGEFDVIIASDVLEHIKNDNDALMAWNRILRSGGKLIVFVPAFDFLWSEHDEINQHYRRYSKTALIDILKMANFEVDRCSYWNFCLFLPASLLRISQRILFKNKNKKRDQLYKLNSITNKILTCLLKIENWLLIKNFNFPFGISIFAVARKK